VAWRERGGGVVDGRDYFGGRGGGRGEGGGGKEKFALVDFVFGVVVINDEGEGRGSKGWGGGWCVVKAGHRVRVGRGWGGSGPRKEEGRKGGKKGELGGA